MALGRKISLTILSLLLGAAAPLSAQGPAGTVAGQVVDSVSQQPLAGVTVAVGERRARTDNDGRYFITGVPAGMATVQATRLGYTQLSLPISVTAGQTATANFFMSPVAVSLQQMVITGYGEQRAVSITGAVQSVKAEEFNTGRVISPEQLIQAKVAGVQIIDSGEPGGGVSIRIRGGSSVTSSNEPLFVVDGVPLAIGGGLSAGRNPLNFLNPGDIANITVLKDASATAIYGSRGANGVVMIETKGGTGRTGLTYSSSVSNSTVTGEPDMLTAEQFRAAVAQYAPENMSKLGTANTDWRDIIQRSGVGQEHALAFSGAGDNLNYRLSLGYLDQDGVVLGSTTQRISAALNYSHQLLSDRLKIQANVKGSRTNDLFTPGGVIGNATAFAPTQEIMDPASPYGGFFEWADPLGVNNPIAELELVVDKGTTYRSVGGIEGKYQLPFLDALSATLRLGYDVTKAERKTFAPSILRGEAETGRNGTISRSSPSQVNSVVDAFLNYVKPLEQIQSQLDVTAGYSYENSEGDFPSFYAQGLSFDLLGINGVPAAKLERTFVFVEESKLASFFGRVNYGLRDQYFLTLSVRRDGSSRFGPDEQWGTFPSAALAWRLTGAPFLDRVPWLSDLKLRASWGVNGNQAFANYRAFSDYVIGDPQTQAQFGNEYVTTIRPSAADPAIKWEETTSRNLGFDYGLFNGRLSGAVDYYHKTTDDLIFTVPVAAGTNLSNFLTTNIGSLKNRGFEFNLNGRVIEGARDGFSWNASFNASTNKNELTRISAVGAGDEQILTGGIDGGVGSTIQVLQPGYAINSFFVYRHKRGPDGKPIYADVNNDGSINEDDLYEDLNGDGKVNQDDRAPYKNPAPKWIFGHSSQMTYRQFDLGYTLRAYRGNYVYNNVASNRGNYRELKGGAPVNLHSSVLETGFLNPQYFSDVYVEDASFIRMDNISLGYSLTRGRSDQPLRLFGTIQNVFTITDYTGVDPMAGVNGIDNNIYPRSRTFTAGFSVGF